MLMLCMFQVLCDRNAAVVVFCSKEDVFDEQGSSQAAPRADKESRHPFRRRTTSCRAEIVRREAAGVWKVSYRLNSSFCEAIKLLYTCKGSAIITGMGKAGLIGQKDRRHAVLDRHAGAFSAPGRGVSRRFGPRPFARRRRDAHAKRRNGRGDAALAVAPRIRRSADRDYRGPHEQRGPRGQRRHRAWRLGRSLFARPRAQHEHDGHAGSWRCARARA